MEAHARHVPAFCATYISWEAINVSRSQPPKNEDQSADPCTQTIQIQGLLDRLQAGDELARGS